jgi:predicted nuclease with TOPRIM domain
VRDLEAMLIRNTAEDFRLEKKVGSLKNEMGLVLESNVKVQKNMDTITVNVDRCKVEDSRLNKKVDLLNANLELVMKNMSMVVANVSLSKAETSRLMEVIKKDMIKVSTNVNSIEAKINALDEAKAQSVMHNESIKFLMRHSPGMPLQISFIC